MHKALLLLLALTASCCLCLGANTPVKPQQHGYEDEGYGGDKGPYEGPSYYGPGDDVYEGYEMPYEGPEYYQIPYERPEHHEEHKHHEERDHDDEESICLQLSDEPSWDADYATMKFRCCKPEDQADFCVNNATYPGHEGYPKKNKTNWDLDEIVHPDTAAACRFVELTETCPASVPTCFGMFSLNCSIAKHACGCSLDHDVYLSAKVIGAKVPVAECIDSGAMAQRMAASNKKAAGTKSIGANRGAAAGSRVKPMYTVSPGTPSNNTPYMVNAHFYKGAAFAKADYGYDKYKGKLEFTWGWDPVCPCDDGCGDPLVVAYPKGQRFAADSQMLIKLMQRKY